MPGGFANTLSNEEPGVIAAHFRPALFRIFQQDMPVLPQKQVFLPSGGRKGIANRITPLSTDTTTFQCRKGAVQPACASPVALPFTVALQSFTTYCLLPAAFPFANANEFKDQLEPWDLTDAHSESETDFDLPSHVLLPPLCPALSWPCSPWAFFQPMLLNPFHADLWPLQRLRSGNAQSRLHPNLVSGRPVRPGSPPDFFRSRTQQAIPSTGDCGLGKSLRSPGPWTWCAGRCTHHLVPIPDFPRFCLSATPRWKDFATDGASPVMFDAERRRTIARVNELGPLREATQSADGTLDICKPDPTNYFALLLRVTSPWLPNLPPNPTERATRASELAQGLKGPLTLRRYKRFQPRQCVSNSTPGVYPTRHQAFIQLDTRRSCGRQGTAARFAYADEARRGGAQARA
ncbi:hypothetical protein G7046_g2670 [Stylonectria norvegica]|nr:hypothetical protein G7046_g2670 [Stylonectria norvegica]